MGTRVQVQSEVMPVIPPTRLPPVIFRPLVPVVLFLFFEFSHILLLTLNMPHTHASLVSSSHFYLTVIRALNSYKMDTKKDLFAHPLAAQLRACNSPGAILLVLQQQIQVHDRSRSSHERLTCCLDTTVNLLYTFSLALEEGMGIDASLAKPILAGVGILLSAAGDARASYDIIADVFEYIVYFFRRLQLYSEVSPTNEMKNIIANMLAEVLAILAIATKEIKQPRMKKLLKKFIGKKTYHIEEALRKLDKLTEEEARKSTSQVLEAIIKSMDEDVNESVAEVFYDEKDDVDEAKCSLSPKRVRFSPYDTIYGWGKDDSLPLYIAPPAYETPEIISLLSEDGAMAESEDDNISLEGLCLWDL